MKRLILLITSLLTLSVNLYSQNLLSDSVVNQPKTILRLSLLLPSFEVEQTIAKNTTIVFNLWTTFSYVKMIYANGSTASLSFYPGFSIQPRFYRNLEERREMGKTTEYYSGMYIGIPLSVIKIAGFGASGSPVTTMVSMKAIEEQLPSSKFMRVHRSYIVNLIKISVVDRNRIVFDGSTYIPVGEQYKAKLKEYIDSNFLGA